MSINSSFGLSKKKLNSKRGVSAKRGFLKPLLIIVIISGVALSLRLLTVEKDIYTLVEGLIDAGKFENVLAISKKIEIEKRYDIRLHKLMARNAYYLAIKNDNIHNDKTEVGWKYFKEAIIHIKKAILLASSKKAEQTQSYIDAVDYYILGFSYMHLGDDKYKEAISYLVVALNKNVKDQSLSDGDRYFNKENLLRMLGYLSYKVGSYKDSIEYYALANKYKKVVLNYLYMGLSHKLLKEYQKAIECLKTANKYTDIESVKINALHNLGWIYFHQGKIKEAKKIYLESVSLDTNFSEGFYWLGNMKERQGDLKGAKILWKRSLVADPNFGPSILKMRFFKGRK